VVGAGINGLVAAHYLRRAGCAVTLLERAERVGGACVSELATVNGRSRRYALGASVPGLMPEFILRETGLAGRLERQSPSSF
jgi:phytoene dehydrogenase-like protein